MDMIESACSRSASGRRVVDVLPVQPLTPGLANKASQITVYDLKSYYNQAKNAVLNIPEMEAKVREATNEDPW
jgi:hypothetical protein